VPVRASRGQDEQREFVVEGVEAARQEIELSNVFMGAFKGLS
jgi:hypothetical protein